MSFEKKALIYFFHDYNGFIDDYIFYQLDSLIEHVETIVFVSAVELQTVSKKRLREKTSFIIEDKSIDYDEYGFKLGLNLLGWENVGSFDEIIFMDFTMFGPVYPFSEVFEFMDKNINLDFWEIFHTDFTENEILDYVSYFAEPLNTFSGFLVSRNSLNSSPSFKKYWQNVLPISSLKKLPDGFFRTFDAQSFQHDSYVQLDDLLEITSNPLLLQTTEIVEQRKCPVFKRQVFFNEYFDILDTTAGEVSLTLYNFLLNKTTYDFDMVWANLLRTKNMADIKLNLHLTSVMSYDKAEEPLYNLKVALMLHIYFEDLIDECCRYAMSMPESCDIYITTHNEDLKKKIESGFSQIKCNKLMVTVIKNRGRDVSSLLIGHRQYAKNYDLVCFAHDKKTNQITPLSIGQSFSYKCWENTLGSKEYVKNIISTFEKEHRLGLLMPPPPNHGNYYGIIGAEWASNFDNVVKLSKKLGIKVDIRIDKESVAPLGTMFWFRPKSFKQLLEKKWVYEDFPEEPNTVDGSILHAIERIYGLVAQQNGFYSRWSMHDRFASLEFTNLNFMLRELSKSINMKIGHQWSFKKTIRTLGGSAGLIHIIKKKLKPLIPSGLWRAIRKFYFSLFS